MRTTAAAVTRDANGSLQWRGAEMRAGWFLLAALVCLAPSCAAAQATVNIAPTSVNLTPGGSQQFSATVTGISGDTSVRWTVQEGASGGIISSAGLYTAPGVVGVYHVVATSNADNTASAIATVALPGFVQTGLISPGPCTATLLNDGNVLYTGGGLPGAGFSTSPAEIYNPTTLTSTATGSMTILRCFETATLLSNGQVLFAGGQTSGGVTATAEIYDPTSGQFTATESMGFAREGHTATLLPDGTVLIAGGTGNCGGSPCALNTAELYNAVTGTFNPTNGPLASPYSGANAVLLNTGNVLIAGGGNALAELYSPSSGLFTQTPIAVNPPGGCTATLLQNGTVLFAGGLGGSVVSPSAEIYDPIAATFTATGSLIIARDLHTATLLPSGQVLIAGGNSTFSRPAAAELYDPVRGTFSLTANLEETRFQHLATALSNGTVLIAGGTGAQPLASIEAYNPASGAFSSQSVFLNAPRTGHATTQLADGRLLLTGGQDAVFDVNSSAEIFDPATGNFSLTGPLILGRYGHTATLLTSGEVLIVGGFVDKNATQIATTAELYNPTAGAFSPAPSSPNVPRALHTATLLGNGQVLIAGGQIGIQQTTSSAELYDPVAGTFTPAGNMDAPRYNHAATLLNDARVFLADGVSGVGAIGMQVAPDDLYDPSTGQFTPVGRTNQLQNIAVSPIDSALLSGGELLADNDTIFDPVSNTLSPIKSSVNFVDSILQDYKFVLLPNNQVFATSNSYPTYLFDPIAKTFTAAASLQYFRSSPTVQLLPNGQVMIVGGAGIAQAEFYVPPVAASSSAPALSSLDPSSAVAGGAPFTLLVNGSNFANNSVVNFNGVPQATTFVNSTQLSIGITATEIVNPGTGTITVTNPATGTSGGGTSNSLPLTILAPNSQPVVGALVPASTTAGGVGFTLSVTGNNFTQSSVVTFNGNIVASTFESPTTLKATIPSSAIAVGGTPLVTVSNGGSSPSIAVTFTVNNPVPQVNQLFPASIPVGSPAMTLVVNGNNFNASSSILVNQSPVRTTFVSATSLQTTLSTGELATGATLSIAVSNPAPGGGVTEAQTFGVNYPSPQATLLSPANVVAGSAAFLLDVTGINFNSASSILVNGTAVSTTFVSTTLLQTKLPASELVSGGTPGGTLNIAVSNPGPGGGTTAPLVFTVDDYSLTVPAAATAVTAGTPATFNFTLAATSETFGFGSPVTFAAVPPLPPNTTATFSPFNPVTPNSVTQTVTLTIATTAHTLASRSPRDNWPSVLLVMLVALAVTHAWICLRAFRLRTERLVPRVLLLFLLLAASGGLAACSGGGYATSAAPALDTTTGTPAGIYTISVTATSGSISHSATVTLTVM